MRGFENKIIGYLLEEQLVPYIFKGNFGLEKEIVRVDEMGMLALTPHPVEFGCKLKNPYITTDFSESQIEIRTPVCSSIQEAYQFLDNLQDIVALTLKNEYLWPQSNPPILPGDKHIPIADFGEEGLEKTKYRERMAKKYGSQKCLLCGIHYNFSFSEDLLLILYKKLGDKQPYFDFRNNIYLKIAKYFLKYRWLLIYLTGASPIAHNTYKINPGLREKIACDGYCCKNLCSIRNSNYGFKNKENFIISYETIEEHVRDINLLIAQGKIEAASELYSPVRLKTSCKEDLLNQLKSDGVGHLEFRIFDLNPFDKNGIAIEDLYLVHLFIIYFLMKPDFVFAKNQQKIANFNHALANLTWVDNSDEIYNDLGHPVPFKEQALSIFGELEDLINTLDFNKELFNGIIKTAKEKVINPEQTYASKLIKEVKEHTYIGFHLQKAKEYLKESAAKTNLTSRQKFDWSSPILIQDNNNGEKIRYQTDGL